MSKSTRVALFFVVAVCIAFAYSKIDAQAQDPTHETGQPVVQDARARDDTQSLSHFDTNSGAPASVAAIVYSQLPSSSGGLYQSSRNPGGTDYDQYVWDNFTIQASQPVTISQVQWRGGYQSGSGTVIDFAVAIYPSIAGGSQPDVTHIPLVQYQTGGNAGETPAGTVGGIAMYDYSFTLPTPFQVTGGTKYWVQIEASQNGVPDWGIAAGTGGDGKHFRGMAVVGDIHYDAPAGDAAFTLLGSPVPDVPISGLNATSDSPTRLGQPTTLTANVGAGSNVAYDWALGDGYAGSGRVITHTYPHTGTFTAIVTASNNVSGPFTATTAVTITDAPIGGLSATNNSPTLLGQPTSLAATVSAGTGVIYEWSLGDGHVGSGQVMTHTYPHTGMFTAVVTASNSASGPFTATTAVTIVSAETPISGLHATNNGPTLWGQATTLTATVAAGSSVVYTWDLGDGHTGDGRVLAHIYSPGVYTAVVTASNSVNALAATTDVIVIAPHHLYLPAILK